jgi:NAD-dependent DNA ligase
MQLQSTEGKWGRKMLDVGLHTLFDRARIDDRQVNELIGLAHGLIADGVINQAEAQYLFKWIAANRALSDNSVVALLYSRVESILADGELNSEEAADLLDALTRFSSGDFELGETLKATSLPLCDPAPTIAFEGTTFCFTGTFAFGTRKECEDAVTKRGGLAGSLTHKTRFLIIGAYATDSWAHSAYGRKIEKAVEMRSRKIPISIVGETHWVAHLRD